MEDNVKAREASQDGKAHDQETQTTFDINGSVVNPPSIHHPIPNTDRSPTGFSAVPWNNARYPPGYPNNQYPYEPSYPTPPPHGP